MNVTKQLHREADRFEQRLARSVLKAGRTLRARVPVDRIAAAFASGSVNRVLEALGDVEDPLEPSARILGDAFTRGAKLTASEALKR